MRNWLKRVASFFVNDIRKAPFLWISTLGMIVAFFDIGFSLPVEVVTLIEGFYIVVLASAVVSFVLKFIRSEQKFRWSVLLFDFGFILFFLFFLLVHLRIIDLRGGPYAFFLEHGWLYLLLFFYFIREFSVRKIHFKNSFLNPAQLFLFSFGVIILIGCLFLLLPRSTFSGISFIDALFMSTSAVCVTGLEAVSVAHHFTPFGQIVLLVLVQLGGIGIMTFASYFSFFFKGGSSYENQIMLKDMTPSNKLGEVFKVLRRILFLTFFIEALGAILIFVTLDKSHFVTLQEQVFFSVFHAIAGFCNAGISTVDGGLYSPVLRFNYPLHLIIAGLFILGSIGFPIIFNLFRYAKYYVLKKLAPYYKKNAKPVNLLWILNINTRIVLVTTGLLLLAGTLVLLFLEYNNGLKEHSFFGKLTTAFFSSAARTSGYNVFDTGSLHVPTLFILGFLMWIGASPGSTGGGIKTSTFAIAFLNIFSFMKGRDRIEVFGREVSDTSVRRAFAIIVLSIMAIGTCTFLLGSIERDKNLIDLFFESVSAYSTSGFSTGITSQLTTTSKLILTVTMFVGRITLLTVLIAFFRKIKHTNYRYPTDDVMIN